jgi:V/A-type H+-transporting ATPase subunit I
MLKPAKMKKIKIIGLLSDLHSALALWRRLGLVQIEYFPVESLNISKGEPLSLYQEISEQLLKIRTIKKYLIPTKVVPKAFEKNPLEIARDINISNELVEIDIKLKELSKEKEKLEKQIMFLKRIENLNISFLSLPNSLSYYLFSIKNKDLNLFLNELKKISNKYDYLSIADPEIKDNSIVFLAIEKDKDLSFILNKTILFEVPKIGLPQEERMNLELKKLKIEEELKHLLYRQVVLSEKYYDLIVRLEEALNLEADLAREALKFAKSSSCFFAQGWIKASDFEKFKNTTQKFLEGRIIIAEIPPSIHNYVGCPTHLENPKPILPFESILKFLYTPNAREIDPSALIFLTIPITYGMIVADAGYALLSILLSLLILSKASKGGLLEALAKIWFIGAIPTFFFGVLFDEYFGFTHDHILGQKLYEPILHRVENIQTLLLYSILLGWITLAFGFILGAINSYSHSKKHALAKIFWLVLQIGGTCAVAGFLATEFSNLLMPGAFVFIIGAIGLILTEGGLALVEIPGLVSNIMSYARVAAVGVAGLILAEAINELLFPKVVDKFTIESFIGFLLLFLFYTFLHFANTFIAMFEAFLHSARLSFLEFFTKFFEGGGRLFSPFRLTRTYTLDLQNNITNLNDIDANLVNKPEKK